MLEEEEDEEEERSCGGEWGQCVQLLESQLWSCASAPVLESHMKGTGITLRTRAVSRSN